MVMPAELGSNGSRGGLPSRSWRIRGLLLGISSVIISSGSCQLKEMGAYFEVESWFICFAVED